MQYGYGAVAADPPWRFGKSAESSKRRSISRQYQTMHLDDIKSLPVEELAAKDCALFLWTIDTHIPESLEVIEAWGFKFKTVAFSWIKTRQPSGKFHIGCGWWTRSNCEMCLLATRGHPKPIAKNVRRLVVSPLREHSRKPDEIYETHIPRLVAGPYLELFSRTKRPGWDQHFSDQADKFSTSQ